MKPVKLVLLLILCSLPIFTQAQLIQWEEGKPLTWDDFKGPVDKNSVHDATTHCTVRYHYRWERRDSVYTLIFDIQSGFDPQTSWAVERSENEDLLKHEQLHFDIHELYVRRMLAALRAATYTSNFKQEVTDIIKTQYAARRAAQEKYDLETNHSKDAKEQVVWESYIHSQLKAIPKNY